MIDKYKTYLTGREIFLHQKQKLTSRFFSLAGQFYFWPIDI